jgi:hypothetical protein
MRGQVAVVKEQGQVFAVLLVKNHVIHSPQQREELQNFGEREFGVRTALIAENGRTWGPRDIVDWLRGVAVSQLPWREFSLN